MIFVIFMWGGVEGEVDFVYSLVSIHIVIYFLPQVILCTKEVNEKTRELAFKLLIKLGYTAQRCSDKKALGN